MTIQQGKRYESKQDPGRIVQVKWRPFLSAAIPEQPGYWVVKVIANEKNPDTVGRHSTVSEETLSTRYKEMSH